MASVILAVGLTPAATFAQTGCGGDYPCDPLPVNPCGPASGTCDQAYGTVEFGAKYGVDTVEKQSQQEPDNVHVTQDLPQQPVDDDLPGIYLVGPFGLVHEPDAPGLPGESDSAAVSQAPSPQILDLRQRAASNAVAGPVPPGMRCAVNSYPPVRKGVTRDYRVQGRAINVCYGKILDQALVECVEYYRPGLKQWYGDFCDSHGMGGPGTLDLRPSGPCIAGIRRYRTESFGSVTTLKGQTFVSDIDYSKNVVLTC